MYTRLFIDDDEDISKPRITFTNIPYHTLDTCDSTEENGIRGIATKPDNMYSKLRLH